MDQRKIPTPPPPPSSPQVEGREEIHKSWDKQAVLAFQEGASRTQTLWLLALPTYQAM